MSITLLSFVKPALQLAIAWTSPASFQSDDLVDLSIQFPINVAVLSKLIGNTAPMPGGPNGGNMNAGAGLLGQSAADAADEMLRNIKFMVARRDVGNNNQRFTPYQGGPNNGNANANGGNMQLSINDGNLIFSSGQQLDGEYLVLIPSQLIAQGSVSQKGTTSAASLFGITPSHIGVVAVVIFAMLLV